MSLHEVRAGAWVAIDTNILVYAKDRKSVV